MLSGRKIVTEKTIHPRTHKEREREREKNEPSGKKIDSAAGQSFSGESSRGDENERGDFVARNRRKSDSAYTCGFTPVFHVSTSVVAVVGR